MIPRILSNKISQSKKSILLLGPRQTGKSTLIRAFSADIAINLAHEGEYLTFARNASELTERLAEKKQIKTIFIDEIQRIPSLLNTIQSIIDEHPGRYKFYLTGSSARKLKRGHANLLPGRIHQFALGPLLVSEVADQFSEKRMLSHGSLPGIWTEDDPVEYERTLLSYAGTYVKEEIQAEALTRNLEGFSRFLFVAASAATRFLDLTKLSSEAAITRASAIRYFEILEDTLIFNRVEAFAKSTTRRLIQHPRYFVFDNGVLNALLGNFNVSPDRIGFLFENLFVSQLIHMKNAYEKKWRISSYRTENSAEVDVILETENQTWAIELKASKNVGKTDLKGLASFADYFGKPHRAVVACLGETHRRIEGVDILPWQDLLAEILHT